MGLDMNLVAKKYVSCYEDEDKEKLKLVKAITGIDTTQHTLGFYIAFDVCYWRKAYSICDWFENHIEEDYIESCKDHYVETNYLIELRDICKRILDGDDEARELLPRGQYEDEEWYMDDVKITYEMLTELDIENNRDKYDYYFNCSW